MLLSTAVVTTDASARYAKQLLSHLGHKVKVEPLPDQPAPAGRLVFAYGIGTVLPQPGHTRAAGHRRGYRISGTACRTSCSVIWRSSVPARNSW